MTIHRRDLVPVSVYLPPEAKAEADRRAAAATIATAALLRQIILGTADPIKV